MRANANLRLKNLKLADEISELRVMMASAVSNNASSDNGNDRMGLMQRAEEMLQRHQAQRGTHLGLSARH